ncbi:uncharacterized protein B0H18DRAFT_1081778 [Fomitopsis serialis]|uniref:uncharacterized protein n=1 Tax=Fomitopsis serialis TaxID=139415 RepID=UPI002007F6BF|nr:uncharacterized protein B0H18DRAFT_1081778 [Neoantrodia serialis]KAH9937662.1 hypothetical protein B0H18DRAFT_1081778 [Neoantrodia serialis]
MSPTPIQPGLVHLILQYIAPPSQLNQPIPPHLISKSLLQRHHFLQISLDDPKEYLCWPTSQGRAIDLLEDLPRQLDDEPASYPVHYTSDAEQAYAHVELPSTGSDKARMVFEWDEADGWKYHDLALMPFPPGSRAAPQQPDDVKETKYVKPTVPLVPAAAYVADAYGGEGEGDDDYWNAYGSQDDAASFNDDPFMASKDAEAGTEDAYWARYSSVHGEYRRLYSPFPPPQPKRKLYPTDPEANSGTDSPNPLPVPARSELYRSHGDMLPIFGSLAPHGSSRWDPASPRALAQLLAEVPPRATPSPSPLSTSETGEVDSDISSPTVGGSNGSDEGSPGYISGLEDRPLAAPRSLAMCTAADNDEAEMGALRDGIRGIWKLWEMGRKRSGTATRNAELGTRVEELERELSVWKAAFKTTDEEKKVLLKTVSRLERSIGSLKAAALLTKGLTDHLTSIDSPDVGRGQLWLTIYCNKTGLLETLSQNNVCDAEHFEAFIMGFNQASPLFSMVDVGSGKEAADAKIKECLRVFSRFPQTSKVFFGGAHDNGYTSTLNYLANEGLLDKVILLRGYKELAYEIKGLQLPHIEIDGLFMKKKLYTHPSKKTNNAPSIPGTPSQTFHDVEKTRSKSSTPAKPTPPKKVKHLPVEQAQEAHIHIPESVFETSNRSGAPPSSPSSAPTGSGSHISPLASPLMESMNAALKDILGDITIVPPAVKSAPKKRRAPRKRKASSPESDGENGAQESAKIRRVVEPEKKGETKEGSPESTGSRRSGRNRDKYSADQSDQTGLTLVSVQAGLNEIEAESRSVSNRVHDPKVFGAIPGIKVGTWWMTREECSIDAVHAPWVGGISGGRDGAWSVALSGGYEDDVDLGDAFTYTGAGGRDLKGTKTQPKNLRTALRAPTSLSRIG